MSPTAVTPASATAIHTARPRARAGCASESTRDSVTPHGVGVVVRFSEAGGCDVAVDATESSGEIGGTLDPRAAGVFERFSMRKRRELGFCPRNGASASANASTFG